MRRGRASAWALRAALAAAVLMAGAGAQAGSVSGPYVIWMNFAEDASADDALHAYTHKEIDADSCWSAGALLLVRDFPPAITPELVRRAVLQREPAAQSRLRALLRKGDADLDRYDGVVVVPKGRTPTLASFSASGKVMSRMAVDKAGQPIWADAFCGVLPPISRKP